MSMTPESSKYFTEVSQQWDKLRTGYFSEDVRSAAISKGYLRPEMVVADVGSGTGFIAAGLAPVTQKVIALDGSAAMLDIARKNLSEYSNIEYHLAESQSLPLEDSSVDVAFANMYLHHCPDPEEAIKEMIRILKSGGRLVITDLDTHSHTWMQKEMADVWLGFERSQIRTWFEEAGLVNTVIDCTGQDCCASSQDGNTKEEEAKISVFVATGTRRLRMIDKVHDTYSGLAQSGGGCGCDSASSSAGSSSCCNGTSQRDVKPEGSVYYSSTDLQNAPAESGDFSLGCGNPTAMAGIKSGETVLDIGSGGGLDSFLAAQKVGPTGSVIGVDMTPAMLQRARRTAIRGGYDNVDFRYGEAEELPVDDNTVDVILSNCVINLTEDKGRVFREAFRVLKPGGRLEISDIVTDTAMSIEDRMNPSHWAACISGAIPEQEYLDLIRQAGFEKPVIVKRVKVGEDSGVMTYSDTISARKPTQISGCCG